MAINDILEHLARGDDMDAALAAQAFGLLMAGELTPAQAGALLMGLRIKGETPVEVTAAVDAALAQARLLPELNGAAGQRRLDTCGTGGDHSCSFNCSTTMALYMAALGYPVVKHGNRSVTSCSGSADVVEALGLPMPEDPADAAAELARVNFVFLFAPHYHPAFRYIMPVRKELGVRTLFNLMGPLLNPGRPTHQLLGVARPQVMDLVGEVLQRRGVMRAAVVCGHGGAPHSRFDELTPFGPAEVVWLGEGAMVHTELDPAAFGFARHAPEDVAVSSKEHALTVVRELLDGGGPEAMRDMLALNLGVGLHLMEEGLGLSEAFDKARAAIRQGVAKAFLSN